jgi:AcrR family transcriptional regulator
MPLSTREQILASAEILFSEKGFRGVSVREITQHAGVNLAAIHYHFGSKEELFVEMVRSVVEPLNRLRLQRMEAIMQADPKPPFRELIAAMIEPMIEAMGVGGELKPHRLLMAGRAHLESAEVTELMQEKLFGELKRRFAEAVASYFPEVPQERMAGRVFLTVSLFIGTMVQTRRVQSEGAGESGAEGCQRIWRDMIEYAAAGIAAPFTAPQEEKA